jgi:hypothetical protein
MLLTDMVLFLSGYYSCWQVFWCSSLGDALAFAHSSFLIPQYCISWHIGDNVLFKFGGVEKHTVFFLFFYLFVKKNKIAICCC